jgi:tRNA 2-thiocytidine biosynthesis protein TtcA
MKPNNREADRLSVSISDKIVRAHRHFGVFSGVRRLLVAVSGGKDSMTLLYTLPRVKKALSLDLDVKALHIRPDFDGCPKDGNMERLLRSWGFDYEILDVAVKARLKPGRSMNCYWCSTQRRTELLRHAEEHGFDAIALGHHMDDMIETLLMNMAYKGEISSMLPVMQYDRYPQKILRPLAYVKEEEIERFVDRLGISSYACTCPYGSDSQRSVIRDIVEDLAGTAPSVKENLFKAMGNVNPRYLPGRTPFEEPSPESSEETD